MSRNDELSNLLENVLLSGDWFLQGVHQTSSSLLTLLVAARDWGQRLGRTVEEIAAVIEPCIRQSMVMSLLPAKALDSAYNGSIDAAVIEHLKELDIDISAAAVVRIRDICLNIRKLQGMSGRQARAASASLGIIRMQHMYDDLSDRQGGRCFYCGVILTSQHVVESLEHVAPKHLGDDFPDRSNWAICCLSCNGGKGNCFAWAASTVAHDYVPRNVNPSKLALDHRWTVLMRDRRCLSCGLGPSQTELWVYRRIRTGLPIPANCAANCATCALRDNRELLTPVWDTKEAGRQVPVPPVQAQQTLPGVPVTPAPAATKPAAMQPPPGATTATHSPPAATTPASTQPAPRATTPAVANPAPPTQPPAPGSGSSGGSGSAPP